MSGGLRGRAAKVASRQENSGKMIVGVALHRQPALEEVSGSRMSVGPLGGGGGGLLRLHGGTPRQL